MFTSFLGHRVPCQHLSWGPKKREQLARAVLEIPGTSITKRRIAGSGAGTGVSRWATCSVTENGCVRILTNPAYPTVSATPSEVLTRLQRFCDSGGHSFWSDDVALRTALDGAGKERLHGYRQVTDFHLAALSAARGGQLATFDGRLERSLAGTGLANAVALVQ